MGLMYNTTLTVGDIASLTPCTPPSCAPFSVVHFIVIDLYRQRKKGRLAKLCYSITFHDQGAGRNGQMSSYKRRHVKHAVPARYVPIVRALLQE